MDLFGSRALQYSRFRPAYPKELIESVVNLVSNRGVALDCATGSGQVAIPLSSYFDKVIGQDKSKGQIDQANLNIQNRGIKNIEFQVAESYRTNQKDNSIDLVTIAQAFHWMDASKMFSEVDRILKKGGTFAIIGYSVCRFPHNLQIQKNFDNFWNLLRSHWDCDRDLLDSQFSSLKFPYSSRKMQFPITLSLTVNDFLSYVETISAYQAYVMKQKSDPKSIIFETLNLALQDIIQVEFPFFFIAGNKI